MYDPWGTHKNPNEKLKKYFLKEFPMKASSEITLDLIKTPLEPSKELLKKSSEETFMQ